MSASECKKKNTDQTSEQADMELVYDRKWSVPCRYVAVSDDGHNYTRMFAVTPKNYAKDIIRAVASLTPSHLYKNFNGQVIFINGHKIPDDYSDEFTKNGSRLATVKDIDNPDIPWLAYVKKVSDIHGCKVSTPPGMNGYCIAGERVGNGGRRDLREVSDEQFYALISCALDDLVSLDAHPWHDELSDYSMDIRVYPDPAVPVSKISDSTKMYKLVSWCSSFWPIMSGKLNCGNY